MRSWPPRSAPMPAARSGASQRQRGNVGGAHDRCPEHRRGKAAYQGVNPDQQQGHHRYTIPRRPSTAAAAVKAMAIKAPRAARKLPARGTCRSRESPGPRCPAAVPSDPAAAPWPPPSGGRPGPHRDSSTASGAGRISTRAIRFQPGLRVRQRRRAGEDNARYPVAGQVRGIVEIFQPLGPLQLPL